MDHRPAVILAEDQHRRCAAALFEGVLELLSRPSRTFDEDRGMVHAAHASCWHWSVVGRPVNRARGEWLVSRVYAVLGKGVQAREHADHYRSMCDDHGLDEYDRAFAHEAIARAAAVQGAAQEVADHVQYGLAAAAQVTEETERAWAIKNLGTVTSEPPAMEPF